MRTEAEIRTTIDELERCANRLMCTGINEKILFSANESYSRPYDGERSLHHIDVFDNFLEFVHFSFLSIEDTEKT